VIYFAQASDGMSSLMLVAKGDSIFDGIAALLAALGSILVLISYVIRATTSDLSVNTRGGVPYCRGCGKQVSYRRDNCRACGLSLYVAKQAPARDAAAIAALRDAELLNKEAIRKNAERWRLEQEGRVADRKAARASRLAARDTAYRSRGIEPGPWVWFKALPELAQAILLGVAFALPAGGLAWALFSAR